MMCQTNATNNQIAAAEESFSVGNDVDFLQSVGEIFMLIIMKMYFHSTEIQPTSNDKFKFTYNSSTMLFRSIMKMSQFAMKEKLYE